MIVSNFRRSILMVLAIALSTVCGSGLSGAEGFLGRYYSNTNLSGAPALTRVDPTINFNWGSLSPATGVPTDNFSVRWVGYLTPPTSGIWTFTTASDDGISLVVNGQTIVRDGTAHAVKEQSGSIELQAGVPVLVDLTYYEAGGLAVAQLYWSGPSVPKQVVPATAVETAESPLLFSTVPTASETSPAFVEARALTGGTVTLTANGAPAPMVSNGVHSFANIPLNPATSVATSLSVGGQVLNRAIAWQPIPLEGEKSRVVRVGDSLLLQAVSAGTWRSIRGSGVGTPVKACKVGDRFPVSFTQPGIYEFVAFNTAEAEVGSLVVNAMSVDFGMKIACEVGFRREKEIKVLGGDFAFLSFSSADPLLIDIAPKGPSTEGGEIYLQPYRRGTPVVYARVGGPTGAILASKEIDEFTLANTAGHGGLVNDETSLTSATLTITPFIPELWFNFSMFAHLSTFKGGAKTFTINTSQALSGLGEGGFTTTTNASGETIGQFQYTLEVPPGETKSCLRAIPQQINSPPKDVGYSTAYNGCWCRVSAEHIELKEGETKPLEINVVKACPDGSVYDSITTSGSTGDSPPYARGKVDCKIPGPVIGINVDCSNFKVNAVPPNGPYPGKYTLYIGGAEWKDLIWVYPGCTSRPGPLPTGTTEVLAGDAYAWNADNGFIPPNGQQSFKAKNLVDTDPCDQKNYNDTFTKNGAVTWRSIGAGSLTHPDQISLQADYTAPGAAGNTFIWMSVKDDGVYAQDVSTPRDVDFKGLTVYKLTDLQVRSGDSTGNLNQETEYRNGYSVEVKAIEITNGQRPELEHSLLDEHGNVVSGPFGSTSNVRVFTIPQEGRYKFQIKNVYRPVETVTSDVYLFFSIKFERETIEYDWDPPAYTEAALKRLEVKGAQLLEDIRKYNETMQVANAIKDVPGNSYRLILQHADAQLQQFEPEVGIYEAQVRRAETEVNRIQGQIAAGEREIARLEASAQRNLALAQQAEARGNQLAARIFRVLAELAQDRTDWQRLTNQALQLRLGFAQDALDAAVTRLRSLNELITSIRTWRTTVVAAAQSNSVFRTMGSTLRAVLESKIVEWGGRVVGVGGIIFDIDSIVVSGGKIDDAVDARSRQDALLQEYQGILDALENAQRPTGPLVEKLVVVSKPSVLDFKLTGNGASWRTFDSDGFIDANWPHLTTLKDSLTNWDGKTWTTGSDGRLEFEMKAYGNLGSETATATRNGMSGPIRATVRSKGSTEDELINRIKPVLDAQKANMEILKERIKQGLSLISAILTAVALFAAVATGTAFILGIIAGIATLANTVISYLWSTATELEINIREKYPK